MNTRSRSLLPIAVLALVAVTVRPGAAAQTSPQPVMFKGGALTPIFGRQKEELLSLFSSKRGVQTLSPSQPQECVNGSSTVQAIACGSTASGQLASNDCFLTTDNSYYDFFSFSGIAGQTVTIDMASTAFDTYLGLISPAPAIAAENDDVGTCSPGQIGGGCDSRITFTLTSSGTWVIVTNSALGNQFGGYTLALQCSGGGSGACTPNATTLCLNNGRFRVEATFATPQGQSGNATAVLETSDTGLFWFFSANNLEAIVKVVNGCTFNQRYWVFAAGLTNVAVTVTVTDTATGSARTYASPQGTPFAPIQDTNAFAACP